MKKCLYLSITVMALAGVVFLGTAATALGAKGIIKTQGSGTGSGSGMTVTELGVENPGTLPTSPFYFLKEWGRGLERLFTFNSVKKAELELRITNEKAAEALKVQETKPDDAEALTIALENYTGAGERLQARLAKLKETSENPNVEKLLEKLAEQTLKHAILLNQLAERWNTDPYVEDAARNQIQGDPDFDLIANAVKDAQGKIQDIVLAAAQKEKNIEQKAAEEIKRAEAAISKLESELAQFAINEPGVSNEKTGPIRLDPTPVRISTNTPKVPSTPEGATERQTPKRDFGDRMKAGLDTAGGILANAKAHLALAKTAFAESKFGEAFGKARSAEVLAKNGSRVLVGVLRPDVGGLEDGESIKKPARDGVDADAPRIEDVNSAMPIVPPDTGEVGEKIVPEAEKRIFPETNNGTREQKPAD